MTRLFPKPPGGRLTSFRFKDKGQQETTATSAPVRGQTRRQGSRRNVERASCTPVCPYSAREGHPAPGPRIVPGRASVGPRRTTAQSRGTATPPQTGVPGTTSHGYGGGPAGCDGAGSCGPNAGTRLGATGARGILHATPARVAAEPHARRAAAVPSRLWRRRLCSHTAAESLGVRFPEHLSPHGRALVPWPRPRPTWDPSHLGPHSRGCRGDPGFAAEVDAHSRVTVRWGHPVLHFNLAGLVALRARARKRGDRWLSVGETGQTPGPRGSWGLTYEE